MIRALGLLLLVLLAVPALAATSPAEMLPDPALEARARVLGKELRCLVCQNQSIDDSDADLARDLRRVVRDRLAAGDSDAQVMAYVTDRYGDFVLLKPPVKPATWLLWFGPAIVLLGGGVLLRGYFGARGGRATEPPTELDAAERERLGRLLADDAGAGRP
jgi:cytochrome c-type biogenesis protein CcmH